MASTPSSPGRLRRPPTTPSRRSAAPTTVTGAACRWTGSSSTPASIAASAPSPPIVGWPHEEFHAYRADVEGNYLKTLELVPAFAERMRQGRREERFTGTAELLN